MITVEHLSHYYGELPALDDVSFEIEAGQIVGLLGLNGAGKSTMLKILSGIILPTAGRVTIGGQDVSTATDDLRRRIGFLPDTPPLYDEMRVDEFLRWCGEMRGKARADVERALPGVLATCQIAGVARTVIGELSHGYKKRVGIAQAIIHKPDLVLLDEPISGLDPVQIVEMREVVRSLREDATVIISSHILSEVAQTCDHLVVLDRGRRLVDGTVSSLVGDRIERTRFELRGARSTIETVLGPHAVDGTPELEEHEDGRVSAVVGLADANVREAVVAALVAEGVGVRAVAVERTELETMFTRAVQQGRAVEADQEVAS